MRLPRALHWRIALAYTALIFVTMGVVSVYLVGFVRDTYIANLRDSLERQARLVGDSAAPLMRQAGAGDADGNAGVNADAGADLSALAARLSGSVGARVELIAADGRVVADSAQAGVVSDEGGIIAATAAVAADDGMALGTARVSVPAARVQPNINRIITTIALSALVVAMLSVGAGYFLFHRTSRSVRAVAEGARRLAEGDLEHRVATTAAEDETRELAEAFNTMASTIRRILQDRTDESAKLTAMLDTMEDGVVVTDAEGAITLVNSAAEVMLGISEREAVGGRLAAALRDHQIQQAAALALASGRICQTEAELLPQRRFLKAIATPLSADGSGGILLTLHDLTEARQMDTTLREFVTNVSHELRSPLASVKAMVETLSEGALEHPTDARNFLSRVNREVDRMNLMVEDLLELSRLESGQQPNLAPVDLAALVSEVAAEYAERADAGGAVVRARLPAGDVAAVALGDGEKLRQALVNLVDNGLKNTAEGSVTLAVEAAADDRGDGQRLHRVCVIDTGAGIAREHLPHIFERFYKVDRARRDGGSGLGLAIAQHIVQTHGGEISVWSEEGVGSEFCFTIPSA